MVWSLVKEFLKDNRFEIIQFIYIHICLFIHLGLILNQSVSKLALTVK